MMIKLKTNAAIRSFILRKSLVKNIFLYYILHYLEADLLEHR